MGKVTIDNVTQTVIDAFGAHGEIAPRQREIMTALVRHLHGFCREVNLQLDEFLAACDFLARAGRISNEKRQEFILLADILGVEVLVDMLTNRASGEESESAVLGPFYRPSPPVLPQGASILQNHYPDQETVLVEGQVRDHDGRPLEGATIDIWQDAPNGLYENQDEAQPDYNLRGRFETDASGRYALRCLRPVPYPIPTDETAGELIRYMGHHAMRPGHLHFIVSAPGCRTLVSQIYDADSAHLDDDAVFAVKESLVGTFEPAGDERDTDLYLNADFILGAA